MKTSPQIATALLLLLACFVLAGCTSTTVTKSADGSWTAKNNSFLWSRQNVAVTVSTNGAIGFNEDSSTPDQKTIAALAGVVSGLVSKAP